MRLPLERLTAGWVAEAVARAENCIDWGACGETCTYRLPNREMTAENLAGYERIVQAAAAAGARSGGGST